MGGSQAGDEKPPEDPQKNGGAPQRAHGPRWTSVIDAVSGLFDSTAKLVTAAVAAVTILLAIGVISAKGGSSDSDSPNPPQPTTSSPDTIAKMAWTVQNDDLVVGVQRAPGAGNPGVTYLMPQGAIDPKSWPNTLTNDFDKYALEHGGIPAGHDAIQMVIRGKTDTPVVVSSITPEPVSRNVPTPGSYADAYAYGCGALPLREAEADLDQKPPKVTYRTDQGFNPVPHLTLSVSEKDPETVVASVLSKKLSSDWQVRIDYDAGSGEKEIIVAGPSGPLTVAAIPVGTNVWRYMDTSGNTRDTYGDPYAFC